MFERKNKEMRSLNVELPAMYAEELEQRLETDPLGMGALAGCDPDVEQGMERKFCLIFSCTEYKG